MSVITTIHTSMIQVVKTALPDYFHITNPYNIANNVGSFLNMGFAISYGASVNNPHTLSCSSLFEDRSMTIFLIRLATHTDNNLECRLDLEHEIMEDGFKLKSAFTKDCNLSNNVTEIQYVGDSGISYISALNEEQSTDKYYSLEIEFLIKYKEVL